MARKRIGLQLEKSAVVGSIPRTNASNEQEYYAPGSSGQLLTVVSGVPTWQTIVFPSSFVHVANQAARPTTGSVDVIYYAYAENTFSIWNGTTYVLVPTSPTINLAGNSGTAQTIASGATLSVLASLGFTTVTSATGNVTITPPSGTATGNVMTYNGTAWVSAAPSFTSFSVAGNTGTAQTIAGSATLTIQGGTASGVTVAMSATNIASITLTRTRETFLPTAAATTVTASATPILSTLQVYRNGDLQDITTDYTVSGAIITFVVAFGASNGATGTEVVNLIYSV